MSKKFDISNYSINQLLYAIKEYKSNIRFKRTMYSNKARYYKNILNRVEANKKVREFIYSIRFIQKEIDFRKENNLYKIKQVKNRHKQCQGG